MLKTKLFSGVVAAVFVLVAFAPGYYWWYAQANSHIIQTSLLIGALYFGVSKKPWLSALLLVVGSFDPRGALLALPLLLWYNRQRLQKFAIGAVSFIAALNLPFFFYYNIGLNFLQTEVNADIVSQIYTYDLVPIFAVITLTGLEVITILDKRWNFLKGPLLSRPKTGAHQQKPLQHKNQLFKPRLALEPLA